MPLTCQFYHITAYQGHFLVLVGKINMFFLEKLRMEMKCHHYDVMEVDFLNLFSHTKTRSDMETDFP
jgi:hypothetical protein